MIKALPYAILMCCWLPLSGIGSPAFPAHAALADTVLLPATWIPSAPSAPVTIRIRPDTALRHYPSIRLEWQLILNGLPAKKGITAPFQPRAGRPADIHLPFRLPPGTEEAFLRVTARLPTRRPHPVYTRLLPLRPWNPNNAITPAGELSFTDTLDIFTITSANILIRFDKQTGWLLHYEAGHTLLMGDSAGLQPMLWQPPVQPRLQLFSTSTGAQLIIVRAEYTVPEAGCLLHLSYTINAAGDMLVAQSMEPDTTREPPSAGSPQLPPLTRFGMRWTLPQDFDSIAWYGSCPITSRITNITSGTGNSASITDTTSRITNITSTAADTSPIPAHSDSIPTHSDSVPTHSDSVPAHSDSVPAHSDSIHSDSVPAIGRIPVSPSRESLFPFVRWLTIGRMQIIADSSLLQITIIPRADTAGHSPILGIDATRPSRSHPLPAGTMNCAFKVSPLLPANPTAIPRLTRKPVAKPF